MSDIKLDKCPFCGKDVAIFSTAKQLEECSNFEEEVCPAFEPDFGVCGLICVVCDFTKGGCGTTTRYFSTKRLAAETWNKRS